VPIIRWHLDTTPLSYLRETRLRPPGKISPPPQAVGHDGEAADK
jgi:hypothetical protein